jgi:hypothetical protein
MMTLDYSACDIIENNDAVRGKFSLREANLTVLIYRVKNFSPLSTCISI